jgi:prepilin-type N-terminal cleavage/methylation domain-containing protein
MSAGCKIMQHGSGKLVDRLAMEQFPLKKQSPVLFNPEAGGRGRTCSAFTLLELLVVLAVVSLLAATLVPTLAGSRIGSHAFVCLNNNRQLCSAWRMYAEDNQDALVYASDDGTGNANPNNQYAWYWSNLDFANAVKNWDTNVALVQRPLWPYTSKDASIFKCPSDLSFVLVNGTPKPRVRSFSMNLYVGAFAPDRSAPPGSPGTTSAIPRAAPYRIFSKATDFTVLPPGMAFVFIGERPEAINWGNFYTDMTGYRTNTAVYEFTQDFPAVFHNFGSSVSFADGRAEIHHWLDARTAPSLRGGEAGAFASPRNPDVGWLQDHATRPK